MTHERWQQLILQLVEVADGRSLPLLPCVSRAMGRSLTSSETSAVVLAAWRLSDARRVALRREWVRTGPGISSEMLVLRRPMLADLSLPKERTQRRGFASGVGSLRREPSTTDGAHDVS